MKLTQDQIKILRDGKIEENRFYLQGQLDRKQYTDINKVLETIGLKWNRGQKAHISELSQEELTQSLDDICDTGEVETLQETIKKFQFYPTPREVVEYLVELADLQEDDTILEPSAGQGAILECISDEYQNVVALELNAENKKILEEKFIKRVVMQGDFLIFGNPGTYSKIIANPPFSKSQDVKHILHMYELLKEGGKLVSVASSSIQWREGKLYDELRSLKPEFIKLPEGSFKESGTMVNTIIVVINK